MTVTVNNFEELGREIEKAAILMIDTAYPSLKIEASVEIGDRLAQTQRIDTGRLAGSTDISGARRIPFDPGLGFHVPTSRTELTQSAETNITSDPPQAVAHVSESAGVSEGNAYGGHVERRYGLGQEAVDATDDDESVVRRAERRAEKALKGRF